MITSDQKDVLFREISSYIKDYKVKSLLDIGAGDGVLAKKLANRVSQYFAIESNKKRAKNFKALGLKVRCTRFPKKIGKRFDMVLASHSIPENKKLYKTFLKTAWNSLNDKGVLLIITFKGQHGELRNLRNKWRSGKDLKSNDEKLYRVMLNILNIYGKVKIHRAVSRFQSENIDEIINLALKSIGPKKSNKEACIKFLKKLLKTKYFSNGVYFFPHEHIFVSVLKHKQ